MSGRKLLSGSAGHNDGTQMQPYRMDGSRAQPVTCRVISVRGVKEVTCCNDGCAVIIAITADAPHDAVLPFQPSILQQPLTWVGPPRF